MSIASDWLKSFSFADSDVPPDVRTIVRFFYVTVAAGFFVTFNHQRFSPGTMTSLLWALASLALGAAIGFLFGIPKVLQPQSASASGTRDNEQNQARQYQQQVNTNLTEISDWLTKIIVGLGLINLKAIPVRLVGMADVLAKGLNPEDQARERAFALAIIIFFSIMGFLFGYLGTRLFLAGAFSRADTAAIVSGQAQLRVEVASLQNSQSLLGASLAPLTRWGGDGSTPSPVGVDQELLAMANDYMNISASDWGQRVRLKDEAAAKMGEYVIRQGISRDLLAEEAANIPNEGLILALATVINFDPQQGDFGRILKVADKATRKHVQYRVVVAVGRLFRFQLLGPADLQVVDGILTRYSQGADASLARLISSTRLSMKSPAQ